MTSPTLPETATPDIKRADLLRRAGVRVIERVEVEVEVARARLGVRIAFFAILTLRTGLLAFVRAAALDQKRRLRGVVGDVKKLVVMSAYIKYSIPIPDITQEKANERGELVVTPRNKKFGFRDGPQIEHTLLTGALSIYMR